MRTRATLIAALFIAVVLTAWGGSDAAPVATVATTTAQTPPALPAGADTLVIGETWLHDMYVGCGTFITFNDSWWMPTETMFSHPDYPARWPVDVMNQGAIDGPDAVIHSTITLVAERRIDIRLISGEPVAVYEPTTDIILCG